MLNTSLGSKMVPKKRSKTAQKVLDTTVESEENAPTTSTKTLNYLELFELETKAKPVSDTIPDLLFSERSSFPSYKEKTTFELPQLPVNDIQEVDTFWGQSQRIVAERKTLLEQFEFQNRLNSLEHERGNDLPQFDRTLEIQKYPRPTSSTASNSFELFELQTEAKLLTDTVPNVLWGEPSSFHNQNRTFQVPQLPVDNLQNVNILCDQSGRVVPQKDMCLEEFESEMGLKAVEGEDLTLLLNQLMDNLKLADAKTKDDTRTIGVTRLLLEREKELKDWLTSNCSRFNLPFYQSELTKVFNPWYCATGHHTERNSTLAETLRCDTDVAKKFLDTINCLDVVSKIDTFVATLPKSEEWHWYTGIVAGDENEYNRRFRQHATKHGTLYDVTLARAQSFDLICLAEMTGILHLKDLANNGTIRSCWNNRNGYDSPTILSKAKDCNDFRLYLLRTKELWQPVRHLGMDGLRMKVRPSEREPNKYYCLNDGSNSSLRTSNLDRLCNKFTYADVCTECNLGFDTKEAKLYHELTQHKVAKCAKCTFSGQLQQVRDHFMQVHL